MSESSLEIGRRLYIHRDSLRLAGERNPAAAAEIAFAMWAMRTVKLMNHRVFDDAEIMGITPPQVVVTTMGALTTDYWPRVTELLRSMRVVPARNSDSGPSALGPEEEIVGSCFFDGYYTFATGPRASVEMLADTRSMREVRAHQNDVGDTKLTVVRGNRLRCPGTSFPHASLQEARADILGSLDRVALLAKSDDLDGDWRRMLASACDAARRLLERHPY